MPTTTIHALPYPTQTAATTGPDVPADLLALADAIDPKLTPTSNSAGTPAALGLAAGKVGRRHRDTNTGNIYLDIGTSWVLEFNAAAGDGISVTGNTIAVRLQGTSGLAADSTGLRAATDDSTIDRSTGLLAVKDAGITAAKIAAALKPSAGAAAAAEALRALGTGAGTAAAGNDSRLSEGVAAAQTVRSLGTGATQAAAGNDGRLSDQRTPLDGTVSTAKLIDRAVTAIKIGTSQIDNEHFAAATKDGAAGTAMLRSLGAGATQAMPGNDSRVADSGWITPALGTLAASSWTATWPIAYRKIGSVVYLRGKGQFAPGEGSGTMPNIFTLPVGYRPTQEMRWPSATHATVSTVRVLADGSVRPGTDNPGSLGEVHLDTVSFLVG